LFWPGWALTLKPAPRTSAATADKLILFTNFVFICFPYIEELLARRDWPAFAIATGVPK
jgi:hypothetical protein